MVPVRKVDLSMWLRANYPVNQSSKSKRKSICGFGINDADYVVNPTINGGRVPCLAYATWRGLIQRSVDLGYKLKHPAYQNVTVWAGWQHFMAFRRWWLLNYIEGYEIDKDLLSPDVKVYSPATCMFIPQWLNVFIKETPNKSKGVLFEADRNKFKATLKHENRTINLGRFDSAQSASRAVKEAKLNIIYSRKNLIEDLRPGLLSIVIRKVEEGA